MFTTTENSATRFEHFTGMSKAPSESLIQRSTDAGTDAGPDAKRSKLLEIINHIRRRNGTALDELRADASLRDDLGFDSMDLAELTVRIEDAFGVDIFENGIVRHVGEVLQRLPDLAE